MADDREEEFEEAAAPWAEVRQRRRPKGPILDTNSYTGQPQRCRCDPVLSFCYPQFCMNTLIEEGRKRGG